ncbi:MAG TPA: transposase [Candidatus Acidoferrales bacterium]|nr:transposase [Candidatus Acidoferrales bacterium]
MGRLTHRTAPGFTYFVTTKTWQNRSIFQVTENAEILIECMLRHRERGAYSLHEFVVMPNHLHLLLTPVIDASLEKAMQLIKGASSHDIRKARSLHFEIWQPGFHEESVRDLNDYRTKVEYIRMNPVRARLVDEPGLWAYSSASGRFQLDAAPERLKLLSSGAEAHFSVDRGMSELKLRPPKSPIPKTQS